MLPGFRAGKPSPGPSAQGTLWTRPETQDGMPPGSAKHLAPPVFLRTHYPWSQQGRAVPRLSVGGRDSLRLVGKQMLPLQPGRQGNRLNQSQVSAGAENKLPAASGPGLLRFWAGCSTTSLSTACAAATELPGEPGWEQQQQKLGQGPEHVTRGRL